MRNIKKSLRTQYLVSFLLKQFRHSIKFFLQTKKGVLIIISVLKFSNPIQKSYFFSLLGLVMPKLIKFPQGPVFFRKLAKYLGPNEKSLMIKIFTSLFSNFLSSVNQIRILDLIYQCFFTQKEKESFKYLLFLKRELFFFSKKKFFSLTVEIFRFLYSGFSGIIKKKLPQKIIGCFRFFLNNPSVISLVIVQEIFWGGLRLMPQKILILLKKDMPEILAFMNNSQYSVSIFSKILKEYSPMETKKIFNYLQNFSQEFLNDQYGHILILLLLIKRSPKKNYIGRKILFLNFQVSEFHIKACLFILRPFSRFFSKNNCYKFLEIKKKEKKKLSRMGMEIIKDQEFKKILKRFTLELPNIPFFSCFQVALLKNLFVLVCFTEKFFPKQNTSFRKKFFFSRIKMESIYYYRILREIFPTRLEKKSFLSKKILIFYSQILFLKFFLKRKKKYFFFFKGKHLIYNFGKILNFFQSDFLWGVRVGNQLEMTKKLFLAFENLIRNKKNY